MGTGDATDTISDGTDLTVSCAEGDTGYVYEGQLEFELSRVALDEMPECPVKVTMNVGNPDRAFEFAAIPNRGVGLARLEFIIARMIGIHPRALLEFDRQPEKVKSDIEKRIAGYANPKRVFHCKNHRGRWHYSRCVCTGTRHCSTV